MEEGEPLKQTLPNLDNSIRDRCPQNKVEMMSAGSWNLQPKYSRSGIPNNPLQRHKSCKIQRSLWQTKKKRESDAQQRHQR